MEVAEADVMMDMMIVAIETEATTVGMTTELELEPGKKILKYYQKYNFSNYILPSFVLSDIKY